MLFTKKMLKNKTADFYLIKDANLSGDIPVSTQDKLNSK